MSIPSLFLILLLFLLSNAHAAAVNEPLDAPKALAHCECRCCHRDLHVKSQVLCDATPKVVPVPHGGTCDLQLINPRDPTTCSAALCHASFPGECLQPSYFTHTCISDRGLFRDWAPLAFASIMLVALAYFASMRASQGPNLDDAYNELDDARYKRETLPEPGMNLLHPLLGQNQVRYDGEKTVEIIDVSPQSLPRRNSNQPPVVNLMATPVRSPSAPYRSATSPLQSSVSSQRDASSPQWSLDLRRSVDSPMASADYGRGAADGT